MGIPFQQMGLAFVEGVALIISPCILPVLPLVLSASVEGGRRRPFGIITGFVIAFSLFVFLSRKLVSLFHIDPDVIKYGSLVLLLLFGLVLLSSKLSEKFSALTQGAADIGSKVGEASSGGFFSGVVIGSLIGLVWTPCAGPVLAVVLVQVIREQSDSAAYLMIFAFSLGAGVPMLAIALAGRKLLGKMGFITNHTEAFRKIVGVIIILSVAFIASGADVQALLSHDSKTLVADAPLALEEGVSAPYLAPDFAPGEWINSRPLHIRDLKGKVVLVDFWTYSCINCIRTLPYIKDWYAKYQTQGFVIIGVHSPEFEFEKKLDNVKAAAVQRGLLYPIVQDNELATWTNFANKFWPAHYLIDRDGKVVYIHYGEGNYDRTENNIRFLLGLNTMAAAPEASETRADQSPETYLGTSRRARFDPSTTTPPLNHWTLTGQWQSEPERIVAEEAGAEIKFHFRAKKAFLVLGTNTGKPVPVTLLLNGQPNGTLSVDRNTLYDLAKQDDHKEGVIEIRADAPGLEAYAFTFGE